MKDIDILIIGGGASGLTAAVCAKDAAPGRSVLVAEKLPRPGKKLLATGNGRCNLMNTGAVPESYLADPAFVRPALEAYQKEYAAFWNGLGLELMQEEEGRVYPACNQASAVEDVLRLGLADRGIELRTDCPVTGIRRKGDGLCAFCGEETVFARRIILATGGKAGKGLGENDSFRALAGGLGHKVTEVYPALTCLKVPRDCIAGLKGIRLKGEIRLEGSGKTVSSEKGEVLFQEDGISGIAAMQLSLRLKGLARPCVILSPLPDGTEEKLQMRRKAFSGRICAELLTGAVNRMIALSALKRSGIAPNHPVSALTDAEIRRLSRELTCWQIPVTGTGDFASAQVMAGGLDTKEFDAETLASRRVPGLYACGEALDVTGPCGGFNLEWAWASGMLAGRKAALE